MVKLNKLGELFAAPLQSAIKAQNLAIQEIISFIEQFGLEKGKIKTFHFEAEKIVEEREINPKTGIPETRFKAHPFELRIPILALIKPPSMQLQEMNVEFAVDIVETKTEEIKSDMIPSGVLGSSLASSRALFVPIGRFNPPTMKVNMKIVRELPEGIARVTDTLTDLLSGIPKEVEPVNKTKIVAVEEIPGIDPQLSKKLREDGILTTIDFLKVTETPESLKKLCKSLKISPKRIEELREKVKLLEKSKK